MATSSAIMVLGVGNVLHGDDGFGIHVINALAQRGSEAGTTHVNFRDGGTIGLALLPEIENSSALIVVDAAEIGAAPGTVRVLLGQEMDRQLSGPKRTVHEVSLSDLMSAAALTGRKPERRALVAVQPASTDWQLEPTTEIRSVIPKACEAIFNLIERWGDDG
jgi:hydrogenase maturation protease